MEAFNLLKFWRTAAVRDIGPDLDSVKKFADAVDNTDEEIDNDEDSFFDLVITGINGYPKETNNSNSVCVNSSSLKQGKSEINSPESPKDVFFKPKPFSIDTNSKPISPNSMLRAVPKFRVCFLGFRKSKPEKVDISDSSTANPKIQTQKHSPKEHSKVGEVPISCVSFRYNSLTGSKLHKEDKDSSINDSSKQSAKADMCKYLKLMKPLYSISSKRYTDKVRESKLSSLSIQSMSSPRNSSEEKQGNRVAVLGAVRKRLGKSRSTTSTFAGASLSPMRRRDDSLLEKNDGIQGAILHCKRSYSSARKDSSVLLSRNANEDLPRTSCEEQNRWSI
ncbi:probable membrane-associated kinase regulator 2 [Lycium ferocissimum]|uniref:probable membrane-associated kinase regulator 2 n=1 Tax=Lycium ferocissimum TaxID=112874 RepID=UPI0028163A32|nr:probable membrane-associated kinase regulator 2 [Lycium ferocissimum]